MEGWWGGPFGFPSLAEQLGLSAAPWSVVRPAPVAPPDYLDTYEVLALAAAELKCAADVIYATHSIPEAMLDATIARLAEAMATVRAIKEGTT